jgi:hypothetical protein
MSNTIAERPAWAERPLDIHDLLEAARANILGPSPSVPVSSLSRSEVGFVNTIMERHYRVSMEREHTGYRHVRTCRQVPPISPLARAALRRAQEALERGAGLDEVRDMARAYVLERSGLDVQPLRHEVPLCLDDEAIARADRENAARTRASSTDRDVGPQQQWTVHHLAIQATPRPARPVVDQVEMVYAELPEHAWGRRPAR